MFSFLTEGKRREHFKKKGLLNAAEIINKVLAKDCPLDLYTFSRKSQTE